MLTQSDGYDQPCGEREVMSHISIDITDDLLLALREQPLDVVQEMRVSAALHYIQTRRLSLGQAARLAGIPRLALRS